MGRRHVDDQGREYWSARELQDVLGYSRWEYFARSVNRARSAAENALGESAAQDQFREAPKMVTLGSGAEREVTDWRLTRYAAYLVAMNGDPSKPEIAP
ncbi:BRO family protein [Rhodococcus sp. SJ-3]|uniref:BRO family protein n=1 Tax=Rhodococcus sp. SJ-3 TaxID=3454628 RepID=UPI003F7A6EB1